MALSAGDRLERYEILEPLGAGGMGEVYRARDRQLDREVAVKVLPFGALADETSRRQVREEAYALSRLNHPNVCTIHDIGEHEGIDFLVMEYIPGETLSDRMCLGPLPEMEAERLGLQLAQGLAAAHERGVIHRDLKPGNLRVTPDGRLKILDFGLARHPKPTTETPADESPRREVTGTLAYMAPEVLEGSWADHRSDIYALGAVLYEMATGRRPFHGATDTELAIAILGGSPTPPSDVNPGVSADLERVITRCLDRDPELRYQSTRDATIDLTRLTSPATVTIATEPGDAIRSRRLLPSLVRWGLPPLVAAVLVAMATVILTGRTEPALAFASRDWILVTDFDNQTGDPLFDKALLTAFTVSLEQSRYANVFPKARVREVVELMGRPDLEYLDPETGREVCQRADIRGLVSCAIGKVGDQYTLTARLLDPATGVAVRSYAETARDQNHILQALGRIAHQLRRDLGESLGQIRASERALATVTTTSLEALKQYTDARLLWNEGKYHEAVELYRAAIENDPDFAMAHAALGLCYSSFIFRRPTIGREHLETALALTGHTTDRERMLIEASYHAGLGHRDEEIRLYRVFLEFYPDDYIARYNLGTVFMNNGRCKEAIEQYEIALRLAPRYVPALINTASCLAKMGDGAESLAFYDRVFELEPDRITIDNINNEYGFVLARTGNIGRAREVFNLAVEDPRLRSRGLRSMAFLEEYLGRYSQAADLFDEAAMMHRAAQEPLSEARVLLQRSMVLEGQGDLEGQLRDLKRAAAVIRTSGEPQAWMMARIGVALVRAGELDRASQLLHQVRRHTDPDSPEQSAELHRLEGELELARGNVSRALELLVLADREYHWQLTVESLARAYRVAGHSDEAIAAYETFVFELASDCTGWEAQARWLAAHIELARFYRDRGDIERAQEVVGRLLELWRNADADLPLHVEAKRLDEEVAGLSQR
jgi:tetratricopeptide (TPR) repeat protein